MKEDGITSADFVDRLVKQPFFKRFSKNLLVIFFFYLEEINRKGKLLDNQKRYYHLRFLRGKSRYCQWIGFDMEPSEQHHVS